MHLWSTSREVARWDCALYDLQTHAQQISIKKSFKWHEILGWDHILMDLSNINNHTARRIGISCYCIDRRVVCLTFAMPPRMSNVKFRSKNSCTSCQESFLREKSKHITDWKRLDTVKLRNCSACWLHYRGEQGTFFMLQCETITSSHDPLDQK